MEAQRERGRAAAHFGGDRDVNRAFEALGAAPTEFLGYDTLEADGVVVGILKDGESVKTAAQGDEVEVVLSSTPFYPEGGGQVGDTGNISSLSGIAKVDDTQRPVGDFIAHRATVTAGSIVVGADVHAAVDVERRLDVMRNHTATHLLHAVLRDMLGSHVRQAGSLVAPGRLRFDYTHIAAVSPDELTEIERTVNDRIRGDLGVVKRDEAQRDALARGALAFFGERYGDTVRTVQIGDPDEGSEETPASFELCGGTHLDRTGQIGFFHVVSEGSVGTGVRRIEAVTGRGYEAFVAARLRALDEAAAKLKSTAEEVPERIDALLAQAEEAKRASSAGQRDASLREAEELLAKAEQVGGVTVLATRTTAPDEDAMRTTGDWLRDKLGSGIVVLGGVFGDRPSVIAMVTQDLVDRGYSAGDIVKAAATPMGGGGGGRPQVAQAGGKEPSKLQDALDAAVASVRDRGA
jgi:alanyl-tRNA synthetase